jgi:hypothetical protein
MANVNWTHGFIYPGDCLYTPAYHLHYVRSWGRNIAGMWIWMSLEEYQPGTCAAVNADATAASRTAVPLSEHEIMWDYPGEKEYYMQVGFLH